jgi:hypothetical protein
MLEEARMYNTSRYKHDYQRSFSRSGYSGKGILAQVPKERKKVDGKPSLQPAWENKFHTLKAQRLAKGECFKCGAKFGPGHKCAATVHLNLVEELVDILQHSNSDADSESSSDSSGSSLMHISECALAGTVRKKSFRLQGTVGDKQVLLLVDSGSCGNFISKEALQLLQLSPVQVPAVTVTVANGAQTTVDQAVKSVNWTCQQAKFCTDFRVFDLPYYDMILGMDWLDTLGPMWIDWSKKTFRISQGGSRVTVRGVKDRATACEPISVTELQMLMDQNAVVHVIQLCTAHTTGTEASMP